ncbi:hypothetical protein GGS21DRAFT_259200 [Xylaria nigripes]|nr:hypothetical protein GGS21DRAFT_259200 [Xylaria nigripes]
MHLHPLIAGVGLLATTTNALLIPPSIPGSDELVTTLPVPDEVENDALITEESKSWTVDLECPGCIVDGRGQPTNIPSHLKLDFTVESGDGTDVLSVNGYELYPNPDPIHNAFTAPVLPEIGNRRMGIPSRTRGGFNRPSKNQPLGFAMGSQTVTTDDDDDDLQLIIIDIQIFSVGDLFVESVPRTQARLVRTPSGRLGIGSIETISFSPEVPAKEQKECATTLCKWRALVSEKLSSIFSGMGCRGSRHGMHNGQSHANAMNESHGARPHHKGHAHRFSRVFMAVVTHILLPVLLGLVAGISIGIIITTVLALAVVLWDTMFHRSGRRSLFRRERVRGAARHENDGTEVEKAGLLNAQEGECPPPYEVKKVEDTA